MIQESRPIESLKIALAHDYLVQDGGAERVLASLQQMFPSAPTFVLVYDPRRAHPSFREKDIRTSFLQKLPASPSHYEWYLPLMPTATEYLDISGYDLVISTSSSFAKGIILPPETRHVCYCHTPTRFLWQDRISYLNDLPQPRWLRSGLRYLLHHLRTWDRLAAERPDHLITNSQTSRQRIQKYYSRDATVIYPPVSVQDIPFHPQPGKFWLAGGRLVGYKRFDLIVRAFAKLDLPLKIFGTGPEFRRLKHLAGKQTEFLGHISDSMKQTLFQEAIGFLHPQMEDFGIAAVEAMAAGKPVIAYKQGGAAETVIDGVTGVYLEAQTWADIGNAIIRFDPSKFDPQVIRSHAEKFSEERFQKEMRLFILDTLQYASAH